MEVTGWLMAGVDAAATAVLLVAGLGKLVSPVPLRRALAEVAPAIARLGEIELRLGLDPRDAVIAQRSHVKRAQRETA